jgi:serine/threonine protein kinase
MELIDGPSPEKSIGSIGPYRIDQRIGRGGMGVVFKAFDSALLRPVAIKVLMPRLAVSPLARVRFAREAQAAAAIKHPNIVRIYSVGEHEGLPYFVMEYVEGITLADRVKREGMLERKSILRIGGQIARGLAAAHDQGLIHRDVKPANILLENGLDQAQITDFGLACVTAEAWRLTASGVLLGTPPYMSPEQAAGAAVDHRSDLFSLGSLLYHLCTGEPPFPGPSVMAILDRVRHAEPRPIRDLNPDIPPALEGHIRRLMAKDPADRFSSANEVARALRDELAEVQGRRPDSPGDDPDEEIQDPEPRPPAPGQGSDIVEWDVLAPRPKDADATTILGTLGRSLGRWARPVSGVAIAVVAMAVAVIAVATMSAIRTTWRDFGDDAPIVLLLGFAGLAVSSWIMARLVTAVRRQGMARPAKPRWVVLLRNALATAILLPTAVTASLEWSAYAQSGRALRAVTARHKWVDSAPPTRQEVEALIGRTADHPPPGDIGSWIEVTYRWTGVFRTYVLRAKYMRLGYDYLLYWISDVLE